MIHDDAINNKLLLLFVLDRLDIPIGEELLVQLCCTDNDWIPPLYCMEIIKEMVKSGFIAKLNPPRGSEVPLYQLTEDGRNCISYFFQDIPKSVRDTVGSYIQNTRMDYRKRQEFNAKYSKNEDGQYTVELSIVETAGETFHLRYVVPTLFSAMTLTNNWTAKAPEIYKLFLDTLMDN